MKDKCAAAIVVKKTKTNETTIMAAVEMLNLEFIFKAKNPIKFIANA